MVTEEDRAHQEQVGIFERLCERIEQFLELHGQPDTLLGLGDYSIYWDYWGYSQVKLSIGNLKLLEPPIVKGLQNILKEFPGWEIVAAVAVAGHFYDWPDMGLIIRGNEIVDDLQRQFLPERFQAIAYR